MTTERSYLVRTRLILRRGLSEISFLPTFSLFCPYIDPASIGLFFRVPSVILRKEVLRSDVLAVRMSVLDSWVCLLDKSSMRKGTHSRCEDAIVFYLLYYKKLEGSYLFLSVPIGRFYPSFLKIE